MTQDQASKVTVYEKKKSELIIKLLTVVAFG